MNTKSRNFKKKSHAILIQPFRGLSFAVLKPLTCQGHPTKHSSKPLKHSIVERILVFKR